MMSEQSAVPSTPSSGKAKYYFDNYAMASRSPNFTTLDDAGIKNVLQTLVNGSTTTVSAAYAADTYLAGSSITIPPSGIKVGTKYKLKFDMVKTGAGTAAFTVTIRFGVNGTTADTARVTFTFAVGTAVIDTGIFEVEVIFRVAGASATAAGFCECTHHLAATGLITTGASGTGIILATASAFDSTVAGSIIGASINGGASFSGTNTFVSAELLGL